MPELVAIGFDSQEKASEARTRLLGLTKEYLLQVGDAVVAHRNAQGEIKLDQMVNMWTIGAAGGSLWGLLAGLLFFNPLLGAAAGAAAGAVGAALTDYGINDDFMRDVAQVLQPGQAALFILADKVSSDKVLERIADLGGRVIRTNLDSSQEQKVRDAFAKASHDGVGSGTQPTAAPAGGATPPASAQQEPSA